jgi:hypothetical protein
VAAAQGESDGRSAHKGGGDQTWAHIFLSPRDYAPGYIGTEIAYSQGGYETGPRASLVAPSVERTLMDVIKRLLPK